MSTDPVFIGYPYPLVDVDSYSRVSDNERIMMATTIHTKLGKDILLLKNSLATSDAHDILDHIKF